MRIFQGQPTSWIQLRPQHIAHWNHKAWPRAHNNLRPFRFQSRRKQKSQQASSARALKFLHVKVGRLAWLFWKSPRRNNGQTWRPSWVRHPTFARLRLQWWAALHCGQSLKLRPDSRFVANWHFLTNPCHILISWCPASTLRLGIVILLLDFPAGVPIYGNGRWCFCGGLMPWVTWHFSWVKQTSVVITGS